MIFVYKSHLLSHFYISRISNRCKNCIVFDSFTKLLLIKMLSRWLLREPIKKLGFFHHFIPNPSELSIAPAPKVHIGARRSWVRNNVVNDFIPNPSELSTAPKVHIGARGRLSLSPRYHRCVGLGKLGIWPFSLCVFFSLSSSFVLLCFGRFLFDLRSKIVL